MFFIYLSNCFDLRIYVLCIYVFLHLRLFLYDVSTVLHCKSSFRINLQANYFYYYLPRNAVNNFNLALKKVRIPPPGAESLALAFDQTNAKCDNSACVPDNPVLNLSPGT